MSICFYSTRGSEQRREATHTLDECVPIDELVRLAKVYTLTACSYRIEKDGNEYQ